MVIARAVDSPENKKVLGSVKEVRALALSHSDRRPGALACENPVPLCSVSVAPQCGSYAMASELQSVLWNTVVLDIQGAQRSVHSHRTGKWPRQGSSQHVTPISRLFPLTYCYFLISTRCTSQHLRAMS